MDLEQIKKMLHQIAMEQNYHDYQLKITPISSGGASFTSFLYTATITSDHSEDLELFIKLASMGESLRQDITLNIYKVEHFVYTDLKSDYRQLEVDHQIPESRRFTFPEYYGARTTVLEEMLVLENLAAKGFVNHDRFKSIDWRYAAAAVTELAKFHALSMAYQRDYPEKYKKFTETYNEDWINENSVLNIWKTSFETSLPAVREDNRDKMKRFLDKIDFKAIMNLYKPLKCKVLAHIDYRSSNLMHKTTEDGNLKIMVVDFQTVQLGCPVIDLLYLIFSGTDSAFRKEYYEKLLDHYYTQLSEAMALLKLDPGTYTREDFDYELKEKLPFGLIIAAFTLVIVTADPEDAPKIGHDMDLSNFAMKKTGATFPDRINGVVDDYVRWGVLTD